MEESHRYKDNSYIIKIYLQINLKITINKIVILCLASLCFCTFSNNDLVFPLRFGIINLRNGSCTFLICARWAIVQYSSQNRNENWFRCMNARHLRISCARAMSNFAENEAIKSWSHIIITTTIKLTQQNTCTSTLLSLPPYRLPDKSKTWGES